MRRPARAALPSPSSIRMRPAPAGGTGQWRPIPANVDSLPENASASGFLKKLGAVEARNDFDIDGYGGPCPPAGKPHRYVITVYALSTDRSAPRAGPPGAHVRSRDRYRHPRQRANGGQLRTVAAPVEMSRRTAAWQRLDHRRRPPASANFCHSRTLVCNPPGCWMRTRWRSVAWPIFDPECLRTVALLRPCYFNLAGESHVEDRHRLSQRLRPHEESRRGRAGRHARGGRGREAHCRSARSTTPAWAELAAADAIIFGAPTYMGGPSADFKKFADASSKPWFGQAWKDKIAAGFTNSATMNGDKFSTIQYFVTLAMQHSMIWAGTGMMPSNTKAATRNDLNYVGGFTGLLTQSPGGCVAGRSAARGRSGNGPDVRRAHRRRDGALDRGAAITHCPKALVRRPRRCCARSRRAQRASERAARFVPSSANLAEPTCIGWHLSRNRSCQCHFQRASSFFRPCFARPPPSGLKIAFRRGVAPRFQ